MRCSDFDARDHPLKYVVDLQQWQNVWNFIYNNNVIKHAFLEKRWGHWAFKSVWLIDM